ncbi:MULTISPECIES: hypothetical protein [Bradyrhizobium]|nr:hypothetical protein QIH91_25210 [Bradyrhizobium japonicum USDA 135]
MDTVPGSPVASPARSRRMHAMLPFIAVVVGLTFPEPAGVALDLLLPAVT